MSAKVWLITTGMCERTALAESLSRLLDSDVEAAGGPYPSYPTTRLGAYPAANVEAGARPIPEKLVEAALDVIERTPRNHLAFIVDDVELENADQTGLIVEHMREGVRRVAQRRPFSADQRRVLDKAKERISFHLFAPMIETYFFAPAPALLRAGVNAGTPVLRSSVGEQFEVDAQEIDFITPADEPKPSWRRPNRRRHPKHYLQFLLEERCDRLYRETHEGVAALRTLEWDQVCAEATPFASSLLEDAADALGATLPFGVTTSPLTDRTHSTIFRNC